MSYRIGRNIKEKMKNVLYERKKYLRRQRELSAQIAVAMIAYSWGEISRQANLRRQSSLASNLTSADTRKVTLHSAVVMIKKLR